MTTRLPHWERRLVAAIETARARPFAWGLHDCPTFAFETRQLLIGGEDVAALWRGRYSTALGGQRMLRRFGWGSLDAMGHALLGEPLPSLHLAQRGDLMLAGSGAGSGFGICLGAQAAGMAPEGLVMRPLTDCCLAWKV
ncbi:DUF6950 family protein [Sedimentimonas flavescens]|uniref:DUF6950 family protein n=1 Tax=Sedimentimonas flavescens TaxID=2851012 RepID=UPI001C49F4DA|nr:hypothetical protein [Sedimentimonas flavescens]MBW0159600.1 hypothetical protein [Sedimentimonas flavescens]